MSIKTEGRWISKSDSYTWHFFKVQVTPFSLVTPNLATQAHTQFHESFSLKSWLTDTYYTESASSTVAVGRTQHSGWANVNTDQVLLSHTALHSTLPQDTCLPPANQLELWQRPSVTPFCLMKKYSFSPFKKAQDLLLAAHQWTITNHYSSKYQYTEADVQSQCVWGRKKRVALEMGFPNENATKTQHKPTCALEPLSSKTATKRWRTP